MLTARDNSNVFLMDRLCAKDRMQAMTSTPHLIDDEQIEAVAYLVICGIVWSAVLLVWVLG